jgi:hypothetical protein
MSLLLSFIVEIAACTVGIHAIIGIKMTKVKAMAVTRDFRITVVYVNGLETAMKRSTVMIRVLINDSIISDLTKSATNPSVHESTNCRSIQKMQ